MKIINGFPVPLKTKFGLWVYKYNSIRNLRKVKREIESAEKAGEVYKKYVVQDNILDIRCRDLANNFHLTYNSIVRENYVNNKIIVEVPFYMNLLINTFYSDYNIRCEQNYRKLTKLQKWYYNIPKYYEIKSFLDFGNIDVRTTSKRIPEIKFVIVGSNLRATKTDGVDGGCDSIAVSYFDKKEEDRTIVLDVNEYFKVINVRAVYSNTWEALTVKMLGCNHDHCTQHYSGPVNGLPLKYKEFSKSTLKYVFIYEEDEPIKFNVDG